MKLYTIGFTKKSAEEFFTLLSSYKITHLIDTRLHPGGQLAGFTKQGDLAYFLMKLLNCKYTHVDTLAPTDEILSEYRKDHDWPRYVWRFEKLMDQRNIPEDISRSLFENGPACLLCSEATPEQCHRRLVAERLKHHWGDVDIVHLM